MDRDKVLTSLLEQHLYKEYFSKILDSSLEEVENYSSMLKNFDIELFDIVKKLYQKGYISVMSCSGHGCKHSWISIKSNDEIKIPQSVNKIFRGYGKHAGKPDEIRFISQYPETISSLGNTLKAWEKLIDDIEPCPKKYQKDNFHCFLDKVIENNIETKEIVFLSKI